MIKMINEEDRALLHDYLSYRKEIWEFVDGFFGEHPLEHKIAVDGEVAIGWEAWVERKNNGQKSISPPSQGPGKTTSTHETAPPPSPDYQQKKQASYSPKNSFGSRTGAQSNKASLPKNPKNPDGITNAQFDMIMKAYRDPLFKQVLIDALRDSGRATFEELTKNEALTILHHYAEVKNKTGQGEA